MCIVSSTLYVYCIAALSMCIIWQIFLPALYDSIFAVLYYVSTDCIPTPCLTNICLHPCLCVQYIAALFMCTVYYLYVQYIRTSFKCTIYICNICVYSLFSTRTVNCTLFFQQCVSLFICSVVFPYCLTIYSESQVNKQFFYKSCDSYIHFANQILLSFSNFTNLLI